MIRRFRDREDAGRQLGEALRHVKGERDLVVLALPRGGVPIGVEVAKELSAPLDVFMVRKLGVPGHEELAMGAIATGGVRVLNHEVVDALNLSDDAITRIAAKEGIELERREAVYRRGRPPLEIAGKTAVLVDDGLATGSTMLAAVKALHERQPASIFVAVPVAPPDTCRMLEGYVDEMICIHTPQPFYCVEACYDDFSQKSDGEVKELLAKADAWSAGKVADAACSSREP